MKVAVTGAMGWVGSAVRGELGKLGVEVVSVSRSPVVAGGVSWLAGRGNTGELARGLKGCDAVVHCAAAVHMPFEGQEVASEMRLVNEGGADELAAAAARAGVCRVVLASSIGVYGNFDRIRPEGGLEPAPTTAYGKSKLRAEEILLASGLDVRVARLATVYGTGDKANFLHLARALRRRRFVIPGEGVAMKSAVDIGNAAGALVSLALGGGTPGVVLDVARPEALSLRSLCEGFCGACGFRRPSSAPEQLLRLAAFVGDALTALGVPAPLTSGRLDKLTRSTAVAGGGGDLTRLGLRWVPFEDSLREHAAYYREA